MANNKCNIFLCCLVLCIVSVCNSNPQSNKLLAQSNDQQLLSDNLQYSKKKTSRYEVYPLFDKVRYQYVGSWNTEESKKSLTIFDKKFNNNNGLMFLSFFNGRYDDVYITMTAMNGDYVDGYQIFTVFNVTNTPFDEEKSTYHYKGPTFFTIIHDLGYSLDYKNFDVDFNITLLNQDLMPWHMKDDKLYRLIATFDLKIKSSDDSKDNKKKDFLELGFKDKNFPLIIHGTSRIEGLEQLQAAYYIFACAIGVISTGIALCYFLKNENYMYTANISSFSLCTIAIYQIITFFYNMSLNLLLEKKSILFGYLSLGSLTMFLSGVINFKLISKALSVQKRHNPNIESRSCKNPIAKYFLIVTGITVVFFVIIYFTMRFTVAYDVITIQVFLSPSVQIVFNAKYCTHKNCFNFYYNVLIWIPLLINPIFLKGYEGNFQRLTPNYILSVALSQLLFTQLLIVVLQKVISPRFGPLKYINGKPHKYFVPIKKIKHEIEEDYICPICFGELIFFETPSGNSKYVKIDKNNEKQNDSSTKLDSNMNNAFNYEGLDSGQIGKKMKKCMVTPCKHYFHPKCLMQWMDHKMECPNCRAVIPPY